MSTKDLGELLELLDHDKRVKTVIDRIHHSALRENKDYRCILYRDSQGTVYAPKKVIINSKNMELAEEASDRLKDPQGQHIDKLVSFAMIRAEDLFEDLFT